MLFDPTLITRYEPLGRGSAVRLWLKRLAFTAVIAVGGGAALLLFAPLL